MQSKTLVTVLITAVVFAVGGWLVGSKTAIVGKTPRTQTPTSQDCRKQATCKIDIYVDACDADHPNPTTCDVYALQDVTLIEGGISKIDFNIKTQGFKFESSDGIAFTALNNGNQIFSCHPQGGNYRCDVSNPSGANGPFKFTIHVQHLNVVDPWVVNY
jgi:hypothetical protein